MAALSIAPSSDIVLGVALAADPDKYRAAAERLKQLGGTRTALDWSAVSEPAVGGAPEASVPSTASMASIPQRSTAARQNLPSTDAFGQLEAFLLQTFLQSMLPRNADHVFGKGTAGEIWKSMLAEKLANELAHSGQLGLARRLAAAHTQAHPPGAADSNGLGPTAGLPASIASVLPYLKEGLLDAASDIGSPMGQLPTETQRS